MTRVKDAAMHILYGTPCHTHSMHLTHVFEIVAHSHAFWWELATREQQLGVFLNPSTRILHWVPLFMSRLRMLRAVCSATRVSDDLFDTIVTEAVAGLFTSAMWAHQTLALKRCEVMRLREQTGSDLQLMRQYKVLPDNQEAVVEKAEAPVYLPRFLRFGDVLSAAAVSYNGAGIAHLRSGVAKRLQQRRKSREAARRARLKRLKWMAELRQQAA